MDQAGPGIKDVTSPRQGTSRDIGSFRPRVVGWKWASTDQRAQAKPSAAQPQPPQLCSGNPHPPSSRVTTAFRLPAPSPAACLSSFPVGLPRQREDGGAGGTCPAGAG